MLRSFLTSLLWSKLRSLKCMLFEQFPYGWQFQIPFRIRKVFNTLLSSLDADIIAQIRQIRVLRSFLTWSWLLWSKLRSLRKKKWVCDAPRLWKNPEVANLIIFLNFFPHHIFSSIKVYWFSLMLIIFITNTLMILMLKAKKYITL